MEDYGSRAVNKAWKQHPARLGYAGWVQESLGQQLHVNATKLFTYLPAKKTNKKTAHEPTLLSTVNKVLVIYKS